MNEQENNPKNLHLWKQLQALGPLEHAKASSQIDPNDLAAYLDGTAKEPTVQRIEAQMCHDPQLLQAVAELRQVRNQPLIEPAPWVLREAVALVSESAETITAERSSDAQTSGTVRRIPQAARWRMGSRWAAAAILILAACLMGYALGHGTLELGQSGNSDSTGSSLLDWPDSAADSMLNLNGSATGGAQ